MQQYMNDRRRIVLASDLSGRCDRALDRAALLASEWDAELVVVHAMDESEAVRDTRLTRNLPSWRQPEQHQTAAEVWLREDLHAQGVAATVDVTSGNAHDVVLAATQHEGVALLVTGIAHDDPLDRIQLGSTVDSLLKDVAVPMLTVRRRARGPYRHVLVATDFSSASGPALATALAWFGNLRVTLFHAFYVNDADLDANPRALEAPQRLATVQYQRFLAESGLTPEATQKLNLVFEHGHTEALLRDFVHHEGVDLVILGTHGYGGFLRTLLGSTAQSLLHLLDCDTMIVRSE